MKRRTNVKAVARALTVAVQVLRLVIELVRMLTGC
jgi:hypothetical protein